MAEEWIVMDGPEDRCFGCGQSNPDGMRMRFRRTGESAVEASYEVPDRYNGAAGVVHGGIQAVLLDEVMGVAAHVTVGDRSPNVTAEFNLRYRRPVPTNTPLLVRGWLVRREEPNLFLEAEICDADGEVLTTASARWRQLG
jgi:uncharacterized protein (TIGR00369 family)